MNKTTSTIIIVIIILAFGVLVIGGLKSERQSNSAKIGSVQNVEVRDGVQYVTINAKAGYSPQLSTAKAGIPTKLIIKTKGTFDCSASLAIKSLNYQKILPQNGEEVIDIGIPEAGKPLVGVCSMGMYNFKIDFNG